MIAGRVVHAAHHHELPAVAHRRRQAAPRPEEAVEVLPVVHAAGVENEPLLEPADRGARRGKRLGPGDAARAYDVGGGRADHHDSILGYVQQLDRVARRRLGDREHEVGGAHELEPRPVAAAQTRIGEVPVGEDLGDQVVERHRQAACPAIAARAGHSRLIGTSSSNGEQTCSSRASRRRRPRSLWTRRPLATSASTEPGGARSGLSKKLWTSAGCAPPERGRELGGVARDATVAVTRALGRLDVDEDGPHRREPGDVVTDANAARPARPACVPRAP